MIRASSRTSFLSAAGAGAALSALPRIAHAQTSKIRIAGTHSDSFGQWLYAKDSGAFHIADALLVTDVGQIISPIGHQGQIDGGFIYGLGNAVMEEMPLDESGKVTTLSLGEYKLPTMMDIPPFRTVLVPAPAGEGPFGAKAAGELGNTAVPAAVANAVARAAGVRLTEFPVTSERIYQALSAKRGAA